MPFTARVESGEVVDITRNKSPRQLKGNGTFRCTACNEQMYVRVPHFIAAHFVHYSACTSNLKCHPETLEHRESKRMVAQHLRGNKGRYEDANLEVVMGQINRRADILATLVGGGHEVHEIQYSAISIDELTHRTQDYEKLGYEVVWYLGGSAATDANRKWCIEQLGGVYSIQPRWAMGRETLLSADANRRGDTIL